MYHSRVFDPHHSRRYGSPTLPPSSLVIDSPRYDLSKLRYFQYLPGRPRPLWVEKRSLVISIDGACRGNHSRDIQSRASSFGVYFGVCSPYNICGHLDSDLPSTSGRAELEAAVQAVEAVAQLDLTPHRTTKVILKTDSVYVYRSLTEWICRWLRKGGKKHWGTIFALHHRIMEVESAKRIRILFWKVPRADNVAADRLANQALDEADSTYYSN